MKKKMKSNPPNLQRAKRKRRTISTKPPLPRTKPELLRMIQKLQVRQTQLERMNKELRQAKKTEAAKDTTERKRAEKALRESAEKYRSLFEESRDPVYITTKEGKFIDINQAGLRLLGYTKEELMDLSVQHVYSEPSERIKFQQEIEKKGFIKDFEVKLCKKDGTEMDCLITSTVRKAIDGRALGYQGIIRNVTERKLIAQALGESEERFHRLYEQAPLGYQSLDAEGRIIGVNQTWLDLLGYSRKEVIGCWFGDFLPPHEVEAFKQRFLCFKATGEVHVDLEMVQRTGSKISVHIDGKIGYGEHGQFKQTHCILNDITERKRTDALFRIQHDLAISLSNTSQLEEGMRFCLEEAFDISGMDSGGFYLVDKTSGALDLVFHKGLSSDFVKAVAHYTADSANAKLVMAGKPIYTVYAELGVSLPEVERHEGLRVIAVVPMSYEGQVIGCLNIASHTLDEVPAFAREVLETIVAETGNAIARLQTERALRESELRFRTLYENSTIGLYRTTPDGKILLANPTLVKMLGYSSFEELASRNLEQEGFEPYYERKQFIEQIEINGEIQNLESGWTCRDGSIKYIRERARAIRDPNGKTLYYDGSAEDITERKQAEEALRNSEERFRSVWENSLDGMRITDKEGTIVAVNDAYCKLVEAKEDELVGQSFNVVYRSSDEETRMAIQHYKDRFFTRTIVPKYEAILELKSGSTPCVDMSNAFLESEGHEPLLLSIFRDVTERKRAEEALRASEEWFRTLADSTSASIIIYQGERIIYVNHVHEMLSGYTEEECLALRFWDLIHPDCRELVRERGLARQRGEPVPDHYEVKIMRKDGEERWIDFAAGKIDWKGQLAVLGTAFDITERKRAEEKLQENEEKLRSLFEQLPIGVSLLDRNRKVIYVNPALEKILNISKDDLLQGKHQTRQYIRPDGTTLPTEELASERAFQEHKLVRDVEIGVITETGKTIWTSVTAEPFPKVEEGLLIVTVDITERKRTEEKLRRSEEQYHTLIESVNDGIVELDSNGVITFANKALAHIHGYERAEDLIGLRMFDLVSSEKREEITRGFLESIASGQIISAILIPFLKKDGSTGYGEVKPTPIITKGSLSGMRAVLRDITERKQVEKQIALLAHTLRSVAECVSITDLNDTVIFVNDAFLKTYGYSEDEIMGKNINIVRSPNNPPEATRDILSETLTGGWHGELLNRRKDGHEFPIELSTSVVRDETGLAVALVGIATDITECKKIEEALKNSESSLQGVLQSTADGILAVGSENEMLYANERFVEIWRIPPALIASRDDSVLLQHVLDQLGNPQSFLDKVQGLYKSKEESFDTLYFKDGRIFERLSRPILEGEELRGRVWSFHDITERKRAEEELRLSEEKYRDLYENNPLMLFSVGIDGTILSVNQTAVRQLEYARDQLIGESVIKVFHSEEQEKVLKTFREFIEHPIQTAPWEFRKVTKSGRIIWVSETSHIVTDKQGIQSVLISCEAITERKRMEEALRESEERFRTVVENQGEGMGIVDAQERFTFVNPAAESIMGVSPGLLMGRNLADFVTPEQWAKIQMQTAERRTGKKSTYEMQIVRPDGETRDLLVTAVPDVQNGIYIGAFGVFRDITERKRMEETLRQSEGKYRNLFDNSEVGMFRTRLDGSEILEFNQKYLKILNYTREEVLGKSSKNMWADQREREKMVKMLNDEGQVTDFEGDLLNKQGEVRRCLTSLRLYRETGILEGSILDITERKQAEKDLRKYQEQLQSLALSQQTRIEEERTRIAREIHDDLGQLLTAIKIDFSMVRKHLSEGTNQETWTLWEQEVDGIVRLIDRGIGSVRKIVRDLRPEVLDTLGILDSIRWQVEDFSRRTAIPCTIQSSIEQLELETDRATTLFRVVQESLLNITKHANASRVEILFSIIEKNIILEIKDDGCGFVPEEVNTSMAFGLLGIRERVRSFSGSVEILSAPMKGTTITITLPL